LNDTTVLNRGIGGDITYGVLKRLDDVINRQPKKLFILLGINDIGKDIPDSVIAYNYFKIIKQVKEKSPATKIYVQSILPYKSNYKELPAAL
jgi:lysophospholipase L1-like esterase